MPRRTSTDTLAFMLATAVLGAGLLSIGAVGLWSVKADWPSLTLAERAIVLGSLVAGLVLMPWVFFVEMKGRVPYGSRTWATVHVASVVLPISGVAGALNHGPAYLGALALAPWLWKNAVKRLDARNDRIEGRRGYCRAPFKMRA